MKVRQVYQQKEFDEVITRSQVCHLSMVDAEGAPYVVPMNFGYENGVVYLHSSPMGKKISILRDHPAVCLAFSTDYQLRYQNEEVACSYGMKYKSVILFGKVEFIEEIEAKTDAMNVIMKQYTGREFPYNLPAIREVCVFKLVPDQTTGRYYGY